MEEIYTSLADVYDTFMDQVPYEKWADFITKEYRRSGLASDLVCDLGCGTGRLTRLLWDRGFDMIGVDASPDMLEVARSHENDADSGSPDRDILYLCQDMRELELYGTVGMVVSACDCLNYILRLSELKKIFRLVNNYLEKDGLFIFDFHTEHYYRDILGRSTFAGNSENASFIWENYYDGKTSLNSYYLTIYANNGGRYDRFEEEHIQRAYGLEKIKELLCGAGLKFIKATDSYTGRRVTAETQRITVVARETYQPGKHYE